MRKNDKYSYFYNFEKFNNLKLWKVSFYNLNNLNNQSEKCQKSHLGMKCSWT